MPTSAPGSKAATIAAARHARGFTLIELMVVVALIALAAGVVSLALRDPAASRLEHDGERLAMLLESARAEARSAGLPVRWTPLQDRTAADFRFVGLPAGLALPERWLDARVQAEVVGAAALTLGPEAIIPAQRVVLRLEGQRIELASDGLAPFARVLAASP